MSDTVQKVKEKLSIVDVISPYVKLTRAGKYWKGLSPFNKEKTPSFFVSPDRGLYHCFSSGKGGDMFTFIEEVEGVDFKGALKILAEKAGVELVPETPGAKDERARLYDALEAANDYFVAHLQKRDDARSYLTSRGVSDESIEVWSLGYSENEWRGLYDHLSKKGFSDSILVKAGLIKQPDSGDTGVAASREGASTRQTPNPKRYYDRFRGRIMFPIRDTSGRVIAFSGRIFEDDAKNPQAKYINSPETDLFDKSRTLYGLDKAKEAIRRLDACVLVEGQLDLILSHQIGYRNTVATSGTAFTEAHAALLKRHSENLLVAYDGDRAGIAAAGRAAAIALRSGLNVKIARLPPESDPADVAHNNPAHFKEIMKEAQHVVDFYLAYLKDAHYDTRTYRMEVSRSVIPFIAVIGNSIDQAHFIGRVSEDLGVPPEAVSAEVAKIKIDGNTASAAPVPHEPFLSRADSLERLITGLMLLFNERGEKEFAREAEAALEKFIGVERVRTLKQTPPSTMRSAVFEADFFLERHPDPEERHEALREVYRDLEVEELHAEYRDVVRLLRTAEASNDSAHADELMERLSALAVALEGR